MIDDDIPDRPHLVSIDGEANRAASEKAPKDLKEQGANDEALRLQLHQLEEEHRGLDVAIGALEERMPYDRLTIQRLKKRKLSLKDEMAAINAKLLPDIIA